MLNKCGNGYEWIFSFLQAFVKIIEILGPNTPKTLVYFDHFPKFEIL